MSIKERGIFDNLSDWNRMKFCVPPVDSMERHFQHSRLLETILIDPAGTDKKSISFFINYEVSLY